jgi:hypothetical protein
MRWETLPAPRERLNPSFRELACRGANMAINLTIGQVSGIIAAGAVVGM